MHSSHLAAGALQLVPMHMQEPTTPGSIPAPLNAQQQVHNQQQQKTHARLFKGLLIPSTLEKQMGLTACLEDQ